MTTRKQGRLRLGLHATAAMSLQSTATLAFSIGGHSGPAMPTLGKSNHALRPRQHRYSVQGQHRLDVLADHGARSSSSVSSSSSPSSYRGQNDADENDGANDLELLIGMFDDSSDEAPAEEGDNCRIVNFELEEKQRQPSLILENALQWMPVFIPILAYGMYDPVAQLFAQCIEGLSNHNWIAVDGGAYQAKIIAPAINGIVIPAISILFANLIGTTISTLRQRQLDLRTAINMEAGQLRILQSMLDAFPQGAARDKCKFYLVEYTSRLIAEGHETVDLDELDLSGMDSELNGLLAELTACGSKSNSLPPSILGQSFSACNKLLEERSKRITALQSTFPPLHYGILGALALSICIAFLMETNQELLVFLNAIQLRLLWTMLVGAFSALALVCFDLGNPFRGSYQIGKSVDQLYTIRDTLRASLANSSVTNWDLAAEGADTSSPVNGGAVKEGKQIPVLRDISRLQRRHMQ